MEIVHHLYIRFQLFLVHHLAALLRNVPMGASTAAIFELSLLEVAMGVLMMLSSSDFILIIIIRVIAFFHSLIPRLIYILYRLVLRR